MSIIEASPMSTEVDAAGAAALLQERVSSLHSSGGQGGGS